MADVSVIEEISTAENSADQKWLQQLDPAEQRRIAAQQARSLKKACHCARMAHEFRGKNVVVLDLTKVTPVFDYFVIATGTNPRQMRAMVDELRSSMKTRGEALPIAEGYESGDWVLQDYGDVVLHVFTADARESYDLESLWADATPVDWQTIAAQEVTGDRMESTTSN